MILPFAVNRHITLMPLVKKVIVLERLVSCIGHFPLVPCFALLSEADNASQKNYLLNMLLWAIQQEGASICDGESITEGAHVAPRAVLPELALVPLDAV